jgi:hypothetical protein
MQEILDVDALMKAAAQAARRNDTAEAASLLRRIVAIQEQSLGPDNVELAPSLNNLALMLERQGEVVDAERCYRRAYDIARRAVGAKDPLALAARDNLVEFLHAIGKLDPLRDDIDDETLSRVSAAPGDRDGPAPRLTLDLPAATGAPGSAPVRSTTGPEPTPGSGVHLSVENAEPAKTPLSTAPRAVTSHETRERGRRQGLTLWVVAGLAAAAIAAWLMLGRSDRASPERVVGDERSAGPTEPVAPPQAPAPATEPSPSEKAPPAPAPPRGPSSNTRSSAETGATTALSAEASLCRRLDRGGGAWRCEAAPESGPTDAVYFYTRVKSPRDLVVRHRWTFEGKTVRTVSLPIRANAREGFRTFSHQRVAEQAGQWEVSLLGEDGTVVVTRQFTVTSQAGVRR